MEKHNCTKLNKVYEEIREMKKRENITWTEAALMCDEEIDLATQDDHG